MVDDLGKPEGNKFISSFIEQIFIMLSLYLIHQEAYIDRKITISRGDLSNNYESNAEGNPEMGLIHFWGGSEKSEKKWYLSWVLRMNWAIQNKKREVIPRRRSRVFETGSCQDLQHILGKVRNSAWLENKLILRIGCIGTWGWKESWGSYLKGTFGYEFFVFYLVGSSELLNLIDCGRGNG